MLKGQKMSQEQKDKIGIANKGEWLLLNCSFCGKEFSIKKCREKTFKFCSYHCAGKSKKPWNLGKKIAHRYSCKCPFCKSKRKEYVPWNKGLKLGANTEHSKRMKGRKLSEEHKKKIGLNGYHYGMLGKKHKIETRILMSNAHKGEKSPNWRGGITKQNIKLRNGIQFRLWRESVFARDNWKCQKCGLRGVHLHAHHLKSFSNHHNLRFSINNGLTLCKVCHKKLHWGK